MRRRALLSLLLLASACNAHRDYEATEDARLVLSSATVLELEPLVVPVVRIDLDGHVGLLFLVDTGASVSSLEPGAARELGLDERPYASASSSGGSDGARVPFDSFVPVDSLTLGALQIEHLRLPLIGNSPAKEFGWAGILGQDVLARLTVVLDGARNQLHLLPAEAGIEEIKAYIRDEDIGDGTWAARDVEYRPRPFLGLSITGEPDGLHEVLIDTGASKTSLTQPVIDLLGLEAMGTYKARSISGVFEGRTYRLEGLGLLGLEVSVEVQGTTLDHGMLGMDVLGELVVVFEGPGRRLWLHLRGPAADAAPILDDDSADGTGRRSE